MLSRKAEDYLEAIYNITEKKGYARIKDIASELQVKPPSVSEMMDRLAEKDLVEYEKYSAVNLTEKGRKIASAVKTRHDTFTTLLEIILIPEEIAKKDACELEHHLHPITVEQFSKFIKFLKKAPMYPEWLNHFKEYCETGTYSLRNKEDEREELHY